MQIEQFWNLIDKWREASDNDTELFYETGMQALSGMETAERKDFRQILAGYMYHVAECVWLDMACKVINGYVSDDTSLYFNLWVVSQGRKVLLDALADPDSLVSLPEIPFGNAEFEMLMGLSFDEEGDNSWGDAEDEEYEEDFEGFSGSPFARQIAPEIKYKNGDKYGGFEDFEDAMEAIPMYCPKLIKRAESEGFNWKDYV